MTGIEEACTAALRKAEHIHAQFGQVLPCLWAVGLDCSVYAVPTTEAGATALPQLVAGMHTVLAASVEAHWIGVTHEVFTQMRDSSEPMPKKGDLAKAAETDPTVQTALIVHGIDTKTGDTNMAMSRLGLSRSGHPVWKETHTLPPQSVIMDALVVTDDLLKEVTDLPDNAEALMQVLGWTAVYVGHDEVTR